MLARLARVLAGCLALAACVPVADQGLVTEKAGPGATPAAEAAAEVEVNGGEAVTLAFRTYDRGWVRYGNEDGEGGRLLEAGEYAARALVSPAHVGPEEAGGLLSAYALDWDAGDAVGSCDTETLAGLSTDIYCRPGTDELPGGHVFLALYVRETGRLLAVTSTFYNGKLKGQVGGTAGAREQPRSDPQAVSPAPSPAQTAVTNGCGPWNAGQWIPAEEYLSSGVTLRVDTSGLWGVANVYQCVVPESGEAYLQAYRDANRPDAPASSGTGGTAGQGQGQGGGGGGGAHTPTAMPTPTSGSGSGQTGPPTPMPTPTSGSGSGRTDAPTATNTPRPLPTATPTRDDKGSYSEPTPTPCTDPFGCDGGDYHE